MAQDIRPLILISNDDGYQAKGINCLVEMLQDMADILVVAPDGPRSGQSRAFTALDYLTLRKIKDTQGVKIYACNGTPVDCTKLAINKFCQDRLPDVIIGGINHGDNASVNAHYSGTMGVVIEGCMKGVPSIGFSLCDHREDADFSPMADIVRRITKDVLDNGLPTGVCINVNVPATDSFRGIKVCRMANATWEKEVVTMRNPRGFDMHWLVGNFKELEPDATDTDRWALQHGYVAVTPTTIDLTAYNAIQSLSERLTDD